MKGHKDKSGKFHPHNNSRGIRSTDFEDDVSNNSVSIADLEAFADAKKNDKRFKQVEIFKFANAPEDLQKLILDKNREMNLDSEFWADYDGLIYDKKSGISDHEALSNYGKKYYDLERGQFLQFPDLKVKDDKKFAQMIGLPESLINKVDFHFESERDNNTELEIKDLGTYEDITKNSEYSDYKKYTNEDDEKLTEKEFNACKKAIDKWSDLMHDAWGNLRDSYEYQYSDEAIKESIESNDYDFDENGDIV